jgi:hypothetical protein
VGSLVLFTVGEFLLVALAVGLPAWGHLAIAAGAINAAALLLFPFIPESARWLLSQGKLQQATELLQAIATANSSRMPQQPLVCSKETSCPADTASHCSYSDSDSETDNSSRNIAGSGSSTNGQQLGLLALLKNRSLLIRSGALLITWYALMQVGDSVDDSPMLIQVNTLCYRHTMFAALVDVVLCCAGCACAEIASCKIHSFDPVAGIARTGSSECCTDAALLFSTCIKTNFWLLFFFVVQVYAGISLGAGGLPGSV